MEQVFGSLGEIVEQELEASEYDEVFMKMRPLDSAIPRSEATSALLGAGSLFLCDHLARQHEAVTGEKIGKPLASHTEGGVPTALGSFLSGVGEFNLPDRGVKMLIPDPNSTIFRILRAAQSPASTAVVGTRCLLPATATDKGVDLMLKTGAENLLATAGAKISNTSAFTAATPVQNAVVGLLTGPAAAAVRWYFGARPATVADYNVGPFWDLMDAAFGKRIPRILGATHASTFQEMTPELKEAFAETLNRRWSAWSQRLPGSRVTPSSMVAARPTLAQLARVVAASGLRTLTVMETTALPLVRLMLLYPCGWARPADRMEDVTAHYVTDASKAAESREWLRACLLKRG